MICCDNFIFTANKLHTISLIYISIYNEFIYNIKYSIYKKEDDDDEDDDSDEDGEMEGVDNGISEEESDDEEYETVSYIIFKYT